MIENVLVGMVENGWDQSGLWTPKLTVSQEWNDGINWFFACCYNFTQIKRWLKILGVKMGVPSHCFFFQSPFNLREVVTACKNQLIPSVHSWDTVNFRVRDQIGYTQFLPSPTKTFSIKFQILWICINMQKMRLSSICSGEIVDLNSLQSDWLRAFWPISQEQDFQDL